MLVGLNSLYGYSFIVLQPDKTHTRNVKLPLSLFFIFIITKITICGCQYLAPGLLSISERNNGRKSAEGRRAHRFDEGCLSTAAAASAAAPARRSRQENGGEMLEINGQGTDICLLIMARGARRDVWG